MVIEYVSFVAEVNWQTVDTRHIRDEWKLTLCLNSQIHEEKVSLRVNADLLHSYGGEPLDVDFCYNRLGGREKECGTTRFCLEALHQCVVLRRLLLLLSD